METLNPRRIDTGTLSGIVGKISDKNVNLKLLNTDMMLKQEATPQNVPDSMKRMMKQRYNTLAVTEEASP